MDKAQSAQSRAHGRPERLARPQFMLVPSLACPANCAYCFSSRDGPSMGPEVVDEALEFVSRVSKETHQEKIRATLHGGEPLVAGHGILRRILEGLRARFGHGGYEVAIQSNLWLLDDEFCELFAEHNVEIGTSLDGPEHITDAQRGEGYFERTMRGIKLAREHGLHVGCIATFTPASAVRWREVAEFFLAQRLSFSLQPCVVRMGDSDSSYSLPPGEFADALVRTFEFYIAHRHEMIVPSLDAMCWGASFGESPVCTFSNCLGMFLAVDPHGGIYPCERFCGMTPYRLGSLSGRPTFAELLNSPIARRMAERQSRVRQACAECEHLDYCLGGCPYNAWAGTLAGVKDPYCEAYHRVFDHIRRRVVQEMHSKENVAAVAQRPFAQDGHPLLRSGPLSELLQRSVRTGR